jgi:hypothetical protein
MKEIIKKINGDIDFYHYMQKKYPHIADAFDPIIEFLNKKKQEVINK